MKINSTIPLGLGLSAASLLLVASLQAGSLTLNFNSAGGTILDTNGVGTGFTTRLSLTGADLPANDTNLVLNTTAGTLSIKSTTADFNGQNGLATMEALGIPLSSLGFSGSNDFSATAVFINVPDNSVLISFDQIGLFVGRDSANLTRGSLVNYDFFNGNNEGIGVNTENGADAGGNFFGQNPGTTLTIRVSRTGGTWQVLVNGLDKTPAQPTFLNSDTNLTVGVYASDTGGAHPTPDNKFVATLDSFTVNLVEAQTAPVINSQPQKQLINEGNPANFSVSVTAETASPRAYQWRRNNIPLTDQTNSTLTVNNVTAANAGQYSVVITNSLGSRTSNIVPLSVILPSATFSLDFSSAGGGVLDTNGIGTGFPTRLPGTGTALTGSDSNLFLNTAAGTLDITTTSSDFNGANGMDVNESLGVALSSLGFTGAQDFNVTATFATPFAGTAQFDQFGIVVGTGMSAHTRAGSITFAAKERYSENVQTNDVGVPVNGGGRYFGFGFDDTIPMTVLLSRTSGEWHHYIDNVQWDPAQPTFLNGATNLVACAFAADVVNGIHKTFSLDAFKTRVFTGPKLGVTAGGGNLTFTWNVVGSGLESNTNLGNAAGWVPVAGATTSPYVIPIPTTGQTFYRIAQ